MAFLAKGRKEDLRVVCEKMGETFPPKARIVELSGIIRNSEKYEEEFVKCLLDSVMTEARRERKEREERERRERKEREERERRERKEKEWKARERKEKEWKAREEREERERERREKERRERREREEKEWRERRERKEKEWKEREEIAVREHQLRMRELDERIRRMKEGNREEVSAGESGDSSNGTGRNFASYRRTMQKVVHKTPDRAEEWPFYFRHVEMMFERYGVPEQHRGLIIWGLLMIGKAKGLYLSYGQEEFNYEAIKQSVLWEYWVPDSRRRRKFNSGDERWVEQQQKEWEQRMEKKWRLGERVQKKEAERSEEKITGERNKQSQLQPVRMEQKDNGAECLLVEEQASSEYSAVPYGVMEVEVREGIVEESPVSHEGTDETGEVKCLSEPAIKERADKVVRQGVAVLTTTGESFEEKYALCGEAGSEVVTVSDDVTLVGRRAQTGDESGHGEIWDSSESADGPVSRKGEERSSDDPQGLQVVVVSCILRRPERKGRAFQGNKEDVVVLQRQGCDRKRGDMGVADREGSRVRSGKAMWVVFERKRRNATRASREKGKARGPKRRRLRNRIPPTSGVARGRYMGDQDRGRPRKGHMGIMKRLRLRRVRFWMGTVTQGLKESEIFWRGNAREFRKLGFRDKPI